MALSAAAAANPPATLAARARAEGSAAHAWPRALIAAQRPRPRDLSDAIHHLLMLHGRQPGLIELAGTRASGTALDWLAAAAAGFAEERVYLNRLAVAAGPMPSTPGHAQSEAAVLAQCHAVEMLARSDRIGCALGAALGLVLDWAAVRGVLDAAAARLGVTVERPGLLAPAELRAFAATLDPAPGPSRAITFGAEQILTQHRRLWDMLDARAHARG